MGRVSLMDELPENSKGEDHGVNAYVDSLLSTVQPDAMSSLDAEILNGVDNLAPLSDVGIEERVDGFESSIGYSPTSGSFEYIENSNASSSASLPAGYNPDREVEKAWTQLQTSQLKAVWEDDFWSSIFDPSHNPFDIATRSTLKRPVQHVVNNVPTEEEDVLVRKLKNPREMKDFHSVVKKQSIQSWRDERDAQWDTAIRRWRALILTWDESERIVDELINRDSFKSQAQVLVDVFYNKAPSTLLKRCNSLGRLCNFLREDAKTFPCSESDVYQFMSYEKSRGAPSSRMKGVLEALTFVRHILGIEKLDTCITSRRCMGAASSRESIVVKQASPLKVSHVCCFHKSLMEDPDIWNRVFCGMVLFCAYSRSRWSDAQHSESLIADRDENGELFYLEASVGIHKTARAIHLRHQFLPLVAPVNGIAEEPWGEKWLNDRLDLGVSDLKVFPLMPAPDDQGIATVRPVSTSEAKDWMHMILKKHDHDISDMRISSHSLKATFLSYLAKRGCLFEDRLALGYHTNNLQMALRYSRDSASRPLRVLEDLIQEIKSGVFNPDATRSGRLSKATPDVLAGDVTHVSSKRVEVKHEISHSDSADVVDLVSDEEVDLGSEDSHCTTDSSSDSGDECVVTSGRLFSTVHVPSGTELWQHSKLKTLHLTFEGHTQIFLCGRKISDLYSKVSKAQRFDIPQCRQCFTSKALED